MKSAVTELLPDHILDKLEGLMKNIIAERQPSDTDKAARWSEVEMAALSTDCGIQDILFLITEIKQHRQHNKDAAKIFSQEELDAFYDKNRFNRLPAARSGNAADPVDVAFAVIAAQQGDGWEEPNIGLLGLIGDSDFGGSMIQRLLTELRTETDPAMAHVAVDWFAAKIWEAHGIYDQLQTHFEMSIDDYAKQRSQMKAS